MNKRGGLAGGQVRRFCDVDAPLDEAAYAELKAAGERAPRRGFVAFRFVSFRFCFAREK